MEAVLEHILLTCMLHADTTMAEYKTYGPGFNATGRAAAANITKVLTDKQYAQYANVDHVFQDATGAFGNTAWIDRHPHA